MSAKARTQEITDQATLFPLEELAPTEPGIAVSIDDRARHLLHTLNLIGQARTREGFGVASAEESRHFPEIAERYDGALTDVRAGAARNQKEAEAAAKWQFAFATGHIALKHSGLIDKEEANRQAREEFDLFHQVYFIDDNAKANRRELRKQLQGRLQRNR